MKKMALLISMFLLVGEVALAKNYSGLIRDKTKLAPITISSGQEMTSKPYKLKAGKYYQIVLKSDGSREAPIVGASFFRNIWVNQISINGIEVRPLGIDSFEFDDEGSLKLTFVPIKPGTYTLGYASARSDRERAIFIVE